MATILFKKAGFSLDTYIKDGVPMVYADQVLHVARLPVMQLVEVSQQYQTDNLCTDDPDDDLGFYVGISLYDMHEFICRFQAGPLHRSLLAIQMSLLKVIGGYWTQRLCSAEFMNVPKVSIQYDEEDVRFVHRAGQRLLELLGFGAEEFRFTYLYSKGAWDARHKTVGPNLLVNVLMCYIPRTSGGAAALSRVRELIWTVQQVNKSEASLFAMQWAIADLMDFHPDSHPDLEVLEEDLFAGILLLLRKFTNG